MLHPSHISTLVSQLSQFLIYSASFRISQPHCECLCVHSYSPRILSAPVPSPPQYLLRMPSVLYFLASRTARSTQWLIVGSYLCRQCRLREGCRARTPRPRGGRRLCARGISPLVVCALALPSKLPPTRRRIDRSRAASTASSPPQAACPASIISCPQKSPP